MDRDTQVYIVTFRDDFAAEFDRLNREWLVRGNFLDAKDELYLAAPRAQIVTPGGEIFFALQHDEVVGTAAAIVHGDDVIELAKLSVSPVAQGRGIGRRLTERVIAFARKRRASRVALTSNTRLTAAVTLYRSLGFEEHECPPGFGYESADVYMELTL